MDGKILMKYLIGWVVFEKDKEYFDKLKISSDL